MGFLHRKFGGGGPETELEDVMRNLRYVLGSKRGSGSFLPKFGLTETGFRTPDEMVVALSREIRETVGLYEPRVEIDDIDELYEKDGSVKLEVRCRVLDSAERLAILLDPKRQSLDVARAKPSKKKGKAP